jgi:hypothetical protein
VDPDFAALATLQLAHAVLNAEQLEMGRIASRTMARCDRIDRATAAAGTLPPLRRLPAIRFLAVYHLHPESAAGMPAGPREKTPPEDSIAADFWCSPDLYPGASQSFCR